MNEDVNRNAYCESGTGAVRFGLLAKELFNPRVIEATRAGVVQLPSQDVSFTVNEESLEEYIRTEINRMKPAVDCYGRFAAKVTIRIELLGDLQEDE